MNEAPSERVSSPKLLAILAWTLVIALGALQAMATRFVINPDGISYLSLGELYARGDWAGAVNGYWSPAYPWLLGMLRLLMKPAGYAEVALAHFLNFVIFLAAFATFRFFLGELRGIQRQRKDSVGPGELLIEFTRPAEVIFAHALFLWSTLVLIGLWYITPDMLIACIVFAIAGVILRLRASNAEPGWYLTVGALAALGYLTKAVMFPIGLLIVLSCAFVRGQGRVRLIRMLVAGAGFLVVASPQIVAMSRLAGHLSYGETGTVAYAQYVNRIPQWWTGAPAGSGNPKHPVGLIHEAPAAYEFSTPNSAFSYPYRDQPAYWADGIRPRFDFRQQAAVTMPILGMYAKLLISLLAGVAVLILLGGIRLPSADFSPLIVPAVGSFLLYALVYSEARYLGAWTVVLFLSAVASLVFPLGRRRAVEVLLAAITVVKLTTVAAQMQYQIQEAVASARVAAAEQKQYAVASAVRSLGVREGAKVASIGYAYDAYWARVARVQIAMEIPDAAEYWAASDSAKRVIHRRFATNGAVAIVANRLPANGPGSGWVPIGSTGYFFLALLPDRVAVALRPVGGAKGSLIFGDSGR